LKTKLFLFCGTIACPLFVIIFLIEGTLRPEYSQLRHPVSSLSIGESGWIQVTNFIITGLLLLAFAFAMKSKLIGSVAIGLIGAGIFSTDPVYGYPEDQPLRLAQFTMHGHLHDLFSLPVFICLPITCFVFRRYFITAGKRICANYSLITGLFMLVTFILAGMGFKQFPLLVDYAGIFQRLSIMSGGAWLSILAWHFYRTSY
jgi:hypothetical membrane protein